MSGEPIIKVRDLRVGYGELVILERINFDVYKGEILAILGESGCGKSTLLRHMIGLNKPQEGRVFIDGLPVLDSRGFVHQEVLRKIGGSFSGECSFQLYDPGGKRGLANIRIY